VNDVSDGRNETPGTKSYLIVFLALVTLTFMELSVVKLDVERAARIAALSGLAIAKAAAVLLFFMHLRSESRALKLIAVTPIVLAPVFAIILMMDAVFRVRGGP
jgi:caa(3)-type oxidase subunit IV